ncbi:FKBP-type peptidyl-prolyl cis-trans isomerase [Tunturibacter psychrotolerans]|uniref:Peptidyl-prolyl cis-trans isomerase n=1 Tax=Tunturiibacter psychrotolerans TaxID=3069686 RepID=A0AAU7ZLE7_9BACT
MIAKLPSITLLAALTTVATAQTTPKATTTTPHHTTAIAKPATTPPNIPKVVGIPKPLFTLRYIDSKIGTGAPAEERKYYTVHYTGWLTNGTKFDSSFDHPGGEPITFPYGAHRVIIGWDTGFQGMHVGGKRRLFVPYQLAYGESGRPPVIPAKADLIFDVELVSMSDTPPQPKTPPAPPTAPESPQKTAPTTQTTPTTPTTQTAPTTQTSPTTPTAPSTPTTPTTPTNNPPHPETL